MRRNKIEVHSGESHSMNDGYVMLNGVRLEGVRRISFFAYPGQVPYAIFRIRVDDLIIDNASVEAISEAVAISEELKDAKV